MAGRRGRKVRKMPLISIHIPEPVLEMIDRIVEEGLFNSRSEFMRHAIVEFLKDYYRSSFRHGMVVA